jgi:hypothetical protein
LRYFIKVTTKTIKTSVVVHMNQRGGTPNHHAGFGKYCTFFKQKTYEFHEDQAHMPQNKVKITWISIKFYSVIDNQTFDVICV